MEPESGLRTSASEIEGPPPDPQWYPEPPRRRSRSQRQAYTFLTLFAVVLLVGLVAAGSYLRWWSFGGDTAQATAATLCPARSTTKPTNVDVNVYNSTQRRGLAAGVAKTLGKRSFAVLSVGNADHAYAGVAEIKYGEDGGAVAARTLALEFAGKVKLTDDGRTDGSIDLVLGKKYHSLVAAKAAATAIARTPAPAGCLTPEPESTAG